MLSITSWNVNSLRQRAEHVSLLSATDETAVICLQELKCKTEDFTNFDDKYRHLVHGQKAYNGVSISSNNKDLELLGTSFDGDPDPEQSRAISAKLEDFTIINLYVPNGNSVGSDKYSYKLNWLDGLISHLRNNVDSSEPVIILGDFNIAPADIDTCDPKKWKDCILVSEEERSRLNQIFDLGYIDLFREMYAYDTAFSWWDYRAGSLQRNAGLRIDLILASEAAAERCTEIEILRSYREMEKPSDHAPVRAFFE